jgi:cytochrome c-type biogenesis protein
MDSMGEVSVFLAFGYGLASFLSPCILPLIPVYLANISGPAAAVSGKGAAASHRWTGFLNSLAFVVGFTIVFTLWGAGAGLIGSLLLTQWTLVLQIVGGLLIAFGVVMLLSLKLPWLNFEKRLRVNTTKKAGLVRSFVIGAIFPIAWTPCASWALGSILLLAGASETAGKGAVLLAAYSLGIGLPFLAAGIALDYLRPVMKSLSRYSTIVYIVSAILLITVGILILTNRLAWFIGRL